MMHRRILTGTEASKSLVPSLACDPLMHNRDREGVLIFFGRQITRPALSHQLDALLVFDRIKVFNVSHHLSFFWHYDDTWVTPQASRENYPPGEFILFVQPVPGDSEPCVLNQVEGTFLSGSSSDGSISCFTSADLVSGLGGTVRAKNNGAHEVYLSFRRATLCSSRHDRTF
jgi:hypothetical protein